MRDDFLKAPNLFQKVPADDANTTASSQPEDEDRDKQNIHETTAVVGLCYSNLMIVSVLLIMIRLIFVV